MLAGSGDLCCCCGCLESLKTTPMENPPCCEAEVHLDSVYSADCKCTGLMGRLDQPFLTTATISCWGESGVFLVQDGLKQMCVYVWAEQPGPAVSPLQQS